MIALSPTSAALLRSAAVHSPATAFTPRSRHHESASSALALSLPASTSTSRPSRPASDSRSPVGVEVIQSAPRRQMVDAATQCSRPATPTNRPERSISTAANARLVTTAESGLVCPARDAPDTQGDSQMTSAVIGCKRNTPDTATALSTSGSDFSRPESDPGSNGSLSKRRRPPKSAVKLLPQKYEDADPRDLVVLISSMLMELIRFNDQIPLRDGRLTRFHSRTPPRISVQDYLQRLTTHATLSPPILLSMVYYIDRLCALYPPFNVSSLTVHRFLISSATVASKGLSDSFWTNKTYARVGGISVAELALLELEFLWRVEWRIVPQPEALVDYYRSLVERCDEYQIQQDDDSGTVNLGSANTPLITHVLDRNGVQLIEET